MKRLLLYVHLQQNYLCDATAFALGTLRAELVNDAIRIQIAILSLLILIVSKYCIAHAFDRFWSHLFATWFINQAGRGILKSSIDRPEYSVPPFGVARSAVLDSNIRTRTFLLVSGNSVDVSALHIIHRKFAIIFNDIVTPSIYIVSIRHRKGKTNLPIEE